MASVSGGRVAEPAVADELPDSFGAGTETLVERHTYALWRHWPLLVVIVLLATGEWLLRKKVGLP
jgi:hypothetical protein